ncbi:MAG TPA: hypothetical protein EYH31_12915 [Anaerolineae bacterium]|nr:hypothetical protein [Anaerolineae bacterium]
MENGGWRMENGKWRSGSIFPLPLPPFLLPTSDFRQAARVLSPKARRSPARDALSARQLSQPAPSAHHPGARSIPFRARPTR